jgi:pimeloyl-ACP methyl ester carboxylesterase
MPTFDHAGATLAYDDSGEYDLPPVVLLPGLSGARSTWARLAAALAGRFRLIAIDHRGHGDSSHVPGTYTLDHFGPDTIALCEHVLGPARPAVLIGHSLGGVIAHHVALRRPDLVRGVFLEDPPLYFGARDEMEASIFPALFTMLRDAFRAQRARGAPLEEYVEGLRSTPAMTGKGTFADVLGEEGTAASARAMFSLDPEVFTPAIEGVGLLGRPLPVLA